MSLEKIIDKITQNTETLVNELLGQAKHKAAVILSRARAEANIQVNRRIEQARREAANLAKREKAIAQLELRKKMLAEKQNLISKIYEKVAEKITTLPDQDYAVFIKKQVLAAAETGKEEILFSAQESNRIGEKFMREINQELKKNGQPGELTAGPPSPRLTRGFILKQGVVELNYSLESILARLREETELKAAEILFREE
jgi:V/A-type H+/Na+-transporting ATPase subunit E